MSHSIVLSMARFPYHRLPSEYAFQDLVWDVCRFLLGEGVEKFAKGKDAGRDGRFAGRANRFPSEDDPLTGKFIIQAKWIQEESASFSDPSFQRLLLKEEAPKAKKLLQAGELDHWLIMSNRRRPAIASTKLENDLRKAVGCKTVYLRGTEELDGWLQDLPYVVRRYDLEALLIPFRVEPIELREVIDALHAHRSVDLTSLSSRWDFEGYAGIEKKNDINELTDRYFKGSIRDQSEQFFGSIKAFLENPRNWSLSQRYHEAAAEIQAKSMAFRGRFGSFDIVIEQLCEAITSTGGPAFQQAGRKRLLRVLLHYMYANCDLGQKSE